MRTNITFDSFDIQDATNYSVKEISHEGLLGKALNIQKFSIADGGRLTSVDFDVRTITIVGTIRGSSKSDLETKIDTFKKYTNCRFSIFIWSGFFYS